MSAPLPSIAIPTDLVVLSKTSGGGFEPNTARYPILNNVVGKLPPGDDVESAVREVFDALLVPNGGCREALIGREAYKAVHSAQERTDELRVNVDVDGRVSAPEVVPVEAKGPRIGEALFEQLQPVVRHLSRKGTRIAEALVVSAPISKFMYTIDLVSPDPIWTQSHRHQAITTETSKITETATQD
jgi:hypothetical protein